MTVYPKVSVIIPTYNHAAYVGQAVESVLAQTYRDFEVLVIDDGSTDNTREVLQPYMDQIRYVYQTNSGESRARNRGIEEAQGEFIAFLDADDFWTPGRLACQVPLLKAQPRVGLVYSDSYRIAADGTILGRAMLTSDHRHLSGNIFPYLLCWQVVNTDTVLVRKACFDRVGLFDDMLSGGSFQCEDWEMWLRVTRNFPVLFVDKPLAFVRYHGLNQSSNLERKAQSQRFILERLLNENELPQSVHSVIPLAFSNVFYKLAREYYARGRVSEARREVLRALRYTPFRWHAHRLLIKTLLGRHVVARLQPLRDLLVKLRVSAS